MSNTLAIRITGDISDIKAKIGVVEANLRQIDSGAMKASGGLNQLERSGSNAAASMGALGGAAARLGPILAGVSVAAFAKSILDAGIALDSLNRSFAAIFGTAGAAAELDFLRVEADRLGQSFYDLAPQFKQIAAAARGTALEGEQTRKIFSAVAEASTALGLSSEQTSGALNALQQMISKGNVQAEELRGQLGERLPGAFQIAARAMGVSTQALNKMLEQGEVLAADLLPKLADELHRMYGTAAETAGLESAQAAVNRLSEAWTDLKNNMFHSETAVAGINKVTDAVRTLAEWANLRSVSETFAQGVAMAAKGKINYQQFVQASFLDRQRMVDQGGPLHTWRGKVRRDMIAPPVEPPTPPSAGGGGVNAAEREAKARQKAYEQMLADGKKAADVLEQYWDDYETRRVAAIVDGTAARVSAAAVERDAIEELTTWSAYSAKAMEDTVSGAFQNMGDALVDFAMTGKASFSDFAESVIADMARIVAQQQIVGPLASAAGDFISGLFSGPSFAAGSAAGGFNYAGELSSFFSLNAKGNVYHSPSLSAYSNGIYHTPQLFAFARGGVFGEAGPEAIMPLGRDSSGNLGVRATGGPTKLVVNIIEAQGKGGQSDQRQEDGASVIDIFFDQIDARIATNINQGRGATTAAMTKTFGLNRSRGAFR